jgi:acetyltransferase-like isoleucine patch superfamily enzyme
MEAETMTRQARIAWTLGSLIAVETMVCAAAVIPVAALWWAVLGWTPGDPVLRVITFGAGVVPSYIAFALLLMPASAAATRLTGWRTADGLTIRIADCSWPLLAWARYAAMNHVVGTIAGSLFRGSPIWSWYLRMNGARLGPRVYVNSLGVADHNLLEFGEGVVIGADAHVSGHTVEGGVLKTARVRLGRGVTVGIAAIVEIDVEAGDGCQIGALSFVPKHTRLPAHATYAGAPVRRIE